MMLMHILNGNYRPFQRYGHFYMLLFPVIIALKKHSVSINEDFVLGISSVAFFVKTSRMLIILYKEVIIIFFKNFNLIYHLLIDGRQFRHLYFFTCK